MPFDLLQNIVVTKLYPALLVVFFFSLTVFAHEYGHFVMARRRGMKVERFSIFGWGPPVFRWTRDGVEYCICWIPFGAYVSIPQMAPMEMIEGKAESKPEELPLASPASRILVAFAGPIMNVVLAAIIACIIWRVGLAVAVNPPIVGWVEPGSREEQLGIRAADRIAKVNGQEVKNWFDIQRLVALSLDPSVSVVIEQKGVPKEFLLETEFNHDFGLKTINLYPEGRPFAKMVLPNSPAEAAGVLPGDEFLAVNDVPISTRQELINFISKKPGQPVRLKVMREGKMTVITATP